MGRMLWRTFRWASSQLPTARSQRFIVAPFPAGQAFQPDFSTISRQAGKPDLPILAERVLQGRVMGCLDLQLAVVDAPDVVEQAARRRPGGALAAGVVDAAVTGAHEQPRLREPGHRTSQV